MTAHDALCHWAKTMTAFPGANVWFPRALELFHVVALVIEVPGLHCHQSSTAAARAGRDTATNAALMQVVLLSKDH